MQNEKPYFIKCSVDKVSYLRGENIVNHPINLSKCTSIEKKQYAWYPDNEGLPSIFFRGCEQSWVYESVAQRDADYCKISNNNFE